MPTVVYRFALKKGVVRMRPRKTIREMILETILPVCAPVWLAFALERLETLEGNMCKNNFVVCLWIFFIGDPFENRCNEILGSSHQTREPFTTVV